MYTLVAEESQARLRYVPDQAILESLEPSSEPLLSALGGVALREREIAVYKTYKNDLVGHPGNNDPRSYGKTGAEGYVDVELLTTHSNDVKAIDAYYQPFLDDDFYRRHEFQDGLPLSGIIRQMFEKGGDGAFIVPQNSYLELLGDLQRFHSVASSKFDARLPDYIRDFSARLGGGELARLVPLFNERVANINIQLDDGFETLIYGHAGNYERWVKILFAPNQADEFGYFLHESAHAMEGSGLKATFGEYGFLCLALGEAFASHVHAYLAAGGNIQTIDPDAKKRAGEYPSERKMLDLLCNGGLNKISIHEFINTAVSDEFLVNQELLAAIEASFPDHPNLLEKLNYLLSKFYKIEDKANPENYVEFFEYLKNVREDCKAQKRFGRIKNKLANSALRRFVS